MEALERKLAAHHAAKEAVEASAAAAAEAAAAGGGDRGSGSGKGRGGGKDGAISDGTDQGDGSSADQTVPGWVKKSKTFGARLAKGGFAGLFDTEDTLVASLAHDWGWASENKIEEYIIKHDAGGKEDPNGALDRVKGVLQELYGTILSLYYYYASATADLDTYTIGPNEFNMFIVDNDVAINGSPECSKHHLEQLFIGVDSGQKVKEEFNKLHALSRQEFLQILIRICVHRYMKPRRRGEQPLFTDVSEAMREFFSVHLFPRLDPAALQVSNDFRQKFVYIEETDEALYEHVETLTALYEVYSGKDHNRSDLTAHSKMLGMDEWLDLCSDLELIDDEFTLREARLCFLWSRLRVADESNAAQRRAMCNLRFEDFNECIVRLCTMKVIPTDEEVEDGGFTDGGEMFLELRKANEWRTWSMDRQIAWNDELRQPIWRCVHHIMAIITRGVEERLLGKDVPTTGNYKLTKKIVEKFKYQLPNKT